VSNSDYQFVGQPLTPKIIESLALELFGGQLVERQRIVDGVASAHAARGGAVARAQDLPRSVKKALDSLRKAGRADNPSFGYWKLGSGSETTLVPLGVEGTSVPAPEVSITSPSSGPNANSDADRTIGDGAEVVYLYYLPAYRELAEQRNESLWPCKVGRTIRDPAMRILAQAATALPERPVLALRVNTNDSAALEKAIHGTLTTRKRQITDSPGSEWFLTSPQEVEEIVSFVSHSPVSGEDSGDDATDDA
jgi:hypothetical protein